MNYVDIKQAIEAHGFCYTDVTTPEGSTVRVAARGPRFPAKGHGERPTVVKASRNGRTLDRVEKPTQGSGAKAYVEMVDRYAEGR